jgi:hypothetical protein
LDHDFPEVFWERAEVSLAATVHGAMENIEKAGNLFAVSRLAA